MVHTMKDQDAARPRGRRQHDRAFKDDLIAQSLVPGASVSAIAMKGGINANLLFKWRREHLRATHAPGDATMLPVCVLPEPATASSTVAAMPEVAVSGSRSVRPGVIEIEVAGAHLRLRGAVDEILLGTVLRALRHSR
ncbi:MAG TPA: transposase [Thermoanaerobaculia bacterium]|nr:transposase [Thermoanaerobaculia bacterium]